MVPEPLLHLSEHGAFVPPRAKEGSRRFTQCSGMGTGVEGAVEEKEYFETSSERLKK